jgi:hypothetical protein
MAGLVPAIHVLAEKDVDGRDSPGMTEVVSETRTAGPNNGL